ncbi:c-type cytochrome [Ramlibacter pallidus]|uniref:C-type cytochrome n=1 Tax=Ramlibacter pallidus TaxID=2780087 RepID=A0ABR9S0F9_9BURK|nr:c-type cytochrome [Ramlibacter pallidus]MBE7366787.1 c-type cytochrome [Ramlibacter pallidus]
MKNVLMAAAAIASLGAQAQSADALYVRSLAANCSNCHGTNGRTAEGSAVPGLAGMPRDYMLQQLQAFRDGTRPATVMHQITKGFTPAQLQQIAGYFAAQPK